MAAVEGDEQLAVPVVDPVDGCLPASHTRRCLDHREVPARLHPSSVRRIDALTHHRKGVLRQGSGHERSIGVEDRDLLGGDGVDGRTEELGVVDVDAGHDRHLGIEHVGRIEPSAQPDLHDADVDRLRGEQRERERRRHLEVGHRCPRRCLVPRHEPRDVTRGLREPVGVDGHSVDGESLLHRVEVR